MKHIFFVILLESVVLSVKAAQPSDQSIEQMMQAMQLEQLIGQTVSQMDVALKSGVQEGLKDLTKGKEPTAAQREATAKCAEKLSAAMKEELAVSKTKQLYVQAYRDTFTQEEVDGIIAFYASPAGKALVEKLPAAMQKPGAQMQAKIAPLMKKLEAMRVDCMSGIDKLK